jgi:hypothetical protein
MPAVLWSWAHGKGVEGRRPNLVRFVRAGAGSSVGIFMERGKKHHEDDRRRTGLPRRRAVLLWLVLIGLNTNFLCREAQHDRPDHIRTSESLVLYCCLQRASFIESPQQCLHTALFSEDAAVGKACGDPCVAGYEQTKRICIGWPRAVKSWPAETLECANCPRSGETNKRFSHVNPRPRRLVHALRSASVAAFPWASVR